jgi:hypothetical protein
MAGRERTLVQEQYIKFVYFDGSPDRDMLT